MRDLCNFFVNPHCSVTPASAHNLLARQQSATMKAALTLRSDKEAFSMRCRISRSLADESPRLGAPALGSAAAKASVMTITDECAAGVPTARRPGGLAAIRALPWIRCLEGWVPPGVAGNVDPTSARVWALRNHPAILSTCGPRAADAFWESKYRFLALRSAILLHSSWSRERAKAVRIADLAKAAGLSTRTAHIAIDRAARTGDLIKRPDDDDARLRILEPTESLIARTNAYLALWLDAMSRFTDRANPLATQCPVATVAARRVFMEMTLWVGDQTVPRRATRFPKTRLHLLWDVLLHAHRRQSAFVDEEAMRLGMTTAAVRKEVERARQDGWLEPVPIIVPSAMATQRFRNLFAVLERRWNFALDLVERGEGKEEAPPSEAAAQTPAAMPPALQRWSPSCLD